MTPARNRADVDRRTIGDERSTKPRRRVDRRTKLIERLAVAIAVACFALGWFSLQHQANDIAASRVDGTRQRCDLVQHIVNALDQARAPKTYAPDLRHDLIVCRRTLKRYQEAR